MENAQKLFGINIVSSDMTQQAENAINAYREKVKRDTGGRISRARAIVKILEKSDYALK